MARVTVTIAQESGSNLQLVKGATVKAYVYDTGQPNNRGTLLATLTETPSNSGQYVFELSETKRIVVTANTGSGEANLPAWEGKKVWGTQATTDDYQDDSVTTVKHPDESITGAKCAVGFLEQWHFTTDIVPAGAIEDAAFNTTEFEKIAGVFRHKANGTSGANITDNTIPDAKIIALDGAKITDATIPAAKIIPETVTGALLDDETLQARSFIPDSLEAGMTNPANFMNTDQFERAGTPLKWQVKDAGIGYAKLDSVTQALIFNNTNDADEVTLTKDVISKIYSVKPGGISATECAPSLLALISASDTLINVLDYGADPTGATSSSQAFDDAMDAADTANRTVVYIPKGTYLVKNVRIHPNTTVLAEGATIAFGGANPDAPDPYELINAIAHIWGADANNRCANVRIQGGTWIGNRAVGVYTEQSDFDIFNTAFCENLNIQFANFVDTGRNAIEMKRADGVTVRDCSFSGIAGKAIRPTACSNVTISSVRVNETRTFINGLIESGVAENENFTIDKCTVKVFNNAFVFKTIRGLQIQNCNLQGIYFASEVPDKFFSITSLTADSPLDGSVLDIAFSNNFVFNFSDSSNYNRASIFQCQFDHSNIVVSNNKIRESGAFVFEVCDSLIFENNKAESPLLYPPQTIACLQLSGTGGEDYIIRSNVFESGSDRGVSVNLSATGKLDLSNNYTADSYYVTYATGATVKVVNNESQFLRMYGDGAFVGNNQFFSKNPAATCILFSGDNNIVKANYTENGSIGIHLSTGTTGNFLQGNVSKNQPSPIYDQGTNTEVDNYAI